MTRKDETKKKQSKKYKKINKKDVKKGKITIDQPFDRS